MPRTHLRRGKHPLATAVVFSLVASLGSEGLHIADEHHNPHGNRRERIEEFRLRTFEANTSRTALRSVMTGGSQPQQPSHLVHTTVIGRRRLFVHD